jgi:hypothetical protein
MGMSFLPPGQSGDRMRLEGIRAREHETEIKANEYAHLHPETDYPQDKRPGVLRRLLGSLSAKRRAE